MGARIIETVFVMTHPGFKKREEEEEVSASKIHQRADSGLEVDTLHVV